MELQNKRLLLTTTIFLIMLVMLIIPFSPFTFGATNATFTVQVTLGNNPPNISWVQSGVSVTPSIGTSATFYIAFNATDPDGYPNINNATANINLSLTGEQPRYDSSCTAQNASGNTTLFNCSIIIWYFDRAGTWTINASVYDLSNAFANNTATTMSVGSLTAVQLDRGSVTFATGVGAKMFAASPLFIDNIGNANITQVNLTAYDLNKTGSSETLTANSFMINNTHNVTLLTLANATKSNMVGAFVPRDMPAYAQNESLNLYVNVSAGLTAGNFNSIYNWFIDVS